MHYRLIRASDLILASALCLSLTGRIFAAEPEVHVKFYVPGAYISTATLQQAREIALHGEPEDRAEAMEFFSGQAAKYADTATDVILHGLKDEDARVRAQAAVALHNLKALPPRAFDEELASLWQRDRFAAALASAYRGIANLDVSRELLAGLSRPEPFEDAAAGGFKVLGSSGAMFVQDDLIRLIDSKNPELSCDALMVLAETRTAPASLVPRMRDWIRRKKDCDWQAAAVLGAIGPAAAEAVPDLVNRIVGTPGECCSWDAQYLVNIGTVSVPALLKAADAKDSYRRAWAVYALAQLGGKDKQAGLRAVSALDDTDGEVRIRAQDGLEKLGAGTRGLAPAIFKRMLKFENLGKSDNLRYEVWPGNYLKLLIPAFPIDPGILFEGWTSKTPELKLTLSKSTAPFEHAHAIDLQLDLQNTGSQPIRIVKSSCSIISGDPIELIVFMDPGWLILRKTRNFSMMSIGIKKDDSDTIQLQPGALETTQCRLQYETVDDTRTWRPATFDYRTVGLGDSLSQLRPGRYKIRAHYRLRTDGPSATRRWSPEQESKYGNLWVGDAISNEITIDVK